MPSAREHAASERVAIVGIGGIFPGSPDLDRFWANIAGAVDATREVPPGRWAIDPADAFDPRVGTARPGLLDARRLRRGLPARPRGARPRSRPARAARPDVPPGAARRPPGVARRRDRGPRPPPRRGRDRQHRPADRDGVGPGARVPGAELRRSGGGRRRADGRGGADRAAEPLRGGAAGGRCWRRPWGWGAGRTRSTPRAPRRSTRSSSRPTSSCAGRADAMLTGGLSRPDPLYTQMGFAQLRALSADGQGRPRSTRGPTAWSSAKGRGCSS